MSYKRTTDPTSYPISRQAAKEHLRLDAVSFASQITDNQSLVADSYSTGNHTGTGIDVTGKSVLVEFEAGDCSSGSVVVKVQESSDDSTYTDVSTFTTVNTDNDNTTYEYEYKGTEPYVRAYATVSTAACDFSVSIITSAPETAEDDFIDTLIYLATDYTEKYLGRALITQTWTHYIEEFPESPYKLSYPPLQSISSIKYYDTGDTVATFSSSYYYVDTYAEPGRVSLNYGETWPSTILRPINGVEIIFVAGYGDSASDVPYAIRHAIKELIAHCYENREIILQTGAIPKEIPFSYQTLCAPYRVIRWPV